jgi:hypothetical protein
MTDKVWVPDYARCWAGVRQWHLSYHPSALQRALLSPLTGGEDWPHNEDMIAQCRGGGSRHPDEFPPVQRCGCGLWAFYSPMSIVNWQGTLDGVNVVSGLVSAWGGIIPYANGFRAECARVEAIFDHPAMTAGASLPISKQAIADTYGADVISPLYFDDYCDRRGFILPPDDGE